MAKVIIQSSWPEAYQAMLNLSKTVRPAAVQPLQCELIKIRVSQINRCAFCLDLHINTARKLGESQQRLDTLAAWRSTDLFTKEEKAMLRKAESLTLLSADVADAETYHPLTSDQEKEVIMITTVINAWNRIMQGIGPESMNIK